MRTETTDVAIIGGGPAGLMLAVELGCRGIDCMLLEEDADPPDFPKANATSARTMEHFRRRGFAAEVRGTGMTLDFPQDITYLTRATGFELARFRVPSRRQASERTGFGDYGEASWPTPELPHRGQQMYIEPIMRRQAMRYPSVRARFGKRVTALERTGERMRLAALDAQGACVIDARFVAGCDGPRSIARKTLGFQYSGDSGVQRDFFGGQMLSIYFRSASLYDVIGKPRSWQYWLINREQRGLLISIDGIDEFMLAIQMKPGQEEKDIDVAAALAACVERPFDYTLIATGPWLAGYRLVADHFQEGPVFLAGDAAHLFTPTGGMGYNTSIDDVVNLGWKLAAVLRGWAPRALLDTYETERRPIALRNTGFARRMADSIGNVAIPEDIEAASAAGEQARQAAGARLLDHVRSEFNIPGLQLGLRYGDSPIIVPDGTPEPPDEPNVYVPNARPGARAPHFMIDGVPAFDRFGPEFTLLAFGGAATGGWEAAARAVGLPLAVLRVDDGEARALYAADLCLIRPDHHVAWRGDADIAPGPVLARVTGRTS